ncbi:MAG: DUF721 domain-containing protein [bacterium]
MSVAEILADGRDSLKLRDAIRRYRIWDRWDEIMGKAVADFAQPARWRGKTLIVRVEHPSWVQELTFLKPQMMERIRTMLPEAGVKEIHFEIGQLPPRPKHSKAGRPAEEPQLSADQQEFVDQVTLEIKDPELREAATRAMKKGLSAGPRNP